jgi:hypothetical protein
MFKLFKNTHGKIEEIKIFDKLDLEEIATYLESIEFDFLLEKYNFAPITLKQHLLNLGAFHTIYELSQEDVDPSILSGPAPINPPYYYVRDLGSE